jgi:hypothetical protein
MDENPQVEQVLEIAQADRRRRAAQAAQAEAEHWDAEYNFWHKIITEEVERLRFNGGYEPVRIDLYPTREGSIAFLGQTQIGHLKFEAVARWASDATGQKVLRLTMLKAK